MAKDHANDAMIRRLEKELEERNSAAQAIIANAQDANGGEGRDLNDAEKETIAGAQNRMLQIKEQLDILEASSTAARETKKRLKDIDDAMGTVRRTGESKIEYRTAGAWMLDTYKASIGDRVAAERLEVYHRVADHQKTPDNLGIIPDPIVGEVINFIDAARPIVSFIGPMGMPSATWHRPLVTQHTSVAAQGTAGAAADEKAELVSQKMTITRLTANAVTLGGYVNVSRQNVDFSTPQALDLVINDLAAQYAIQSEIATGAELAATTTTAVDIPLAATAEDVAAAVWAAVSQVYTATRGQGRLGLAIPPALLQLFGPLFAPVNPRDAQSPGFTAGMFGQGQMGTISGVPVVMSNGLTSPTTGFLFSTAAIETFEQRVGTLQVTEPSVLGVQVAYAGYFTPLTITDAGIVPIEHLQA